MTKVFNTLKITLTIIILLVMVSSLFSNPVSADIKKFKETCSTNEVTEDCRPLKLSDAQILVSKILAVAWPMGALIFLVLLVINGIKYMTATSSDGAKEAQKKMTQWLIGIFLYFLSYPIMNTILGALVGDSPCYEDLKEPGFTFFFPEVCNQVEINNPSSTTNTTNKSNDTVTPTEYISK